MFRRHIIYIYIYIYREREREREKERKREREREKERKREREREKGGDYNLKYCFSFGVYDVQVVFHSSCNSWQRRLSRNTSYRKDATDGDKWNQIKVLTDLQKENIHKH